MREKTSKRGMPRRAAGRSPARRPKATGPGEAGAPCGPEPSPCKDPRRRKTAARRLGKAL